MGDCAERKLAAKGMSGLWDWLWECLQDCTHWPRPNTRLRLLQASYVSGTPQDLKDRHFSYRQNKKNICLRDNFFLGRCNLSIALFNTISFFFYLIFNIFFNTDSLFLLPELSCHFNDDRGQGKMFHLMPLWLNTGLKQRRCTWRPGKGASQTAQEKVITEQWCQDGVRNWERERNWPISQGSPVRDPGINGTLIFDRQAWKSWKTIYP